MLLITRFLLFLIVFISKSIFASENSPEVETSLGKIKGLYKESKKGKVYSAFEGIPFAKPPIGNLRFEDPEPVEPWNGIINATVFKFCVQENFDLVTKVSKGVIGDEDCLNLNIYVPSKIIDSKSKYDVVVFIHGGAFIMGSGLFINADYLMDTDCIFVSIHYRLHILGFLSTEDDVIPGNFGMKDQSLALKWIQSHISSFGGNPDSVTIAGLSAGGASVHLHYFSPLSKGLFQRGISQSGTVLDPWTIKENPLRNAKKLAAALGCPESSVEMKTCLKSKPANLIIEKLSLFYGFGKEPFSPFAPVIEKNYTKAFLVEHPYLMLMEKKVADLPWIVSTTTDEGIVPTVFYTSDKDIQEINDRWNDVAPHLLDYNETVPISKQSDISNKIRKHYLGNDTIKPGSLKYVKIFTDRLFGVGSETSAKLQSKANQAPVYYYLFNYEGSISIPGWDSIKGNSETKVSHAKDAIYCYGIFFENASRSDKIIGDGCLEMLYSFAHTGIPKYVIENWPPTKGDNLTYLNITSPDSIVIETKSYLRPVEFWNSLGILENENLFSDIKK